MDEVARRKRRVVIRWAAIVPLSFLIWYAVLLLAGGLAGLVVRFCPPESLLGDYCSADWARTAERAITVSCAGLAALLIVLGAAWVAPVYRFRVAVVVSTIGVLLSVNMAAHAGAMAEFVAALVGAALGTLAARLLPQSAVV